MYVAHINGQLLTFKTNKGVFPLAFASKELAQPFISAQLPAAKVQTAEEIAALNPQAFVQPVRVLHLASSSIFAAFITNPGTFPTEHYLVTLPALTPAKPKQPPVANSQQDKFDLSE
jgi:hypothetical protein